MIRLNSLILHEFGWLYDHSFIHSVQIWRYIYSPFRFKVAPSPGLTRMLFCGHLSILYTTTITTYRVLFAKHSNIPSKPRLPLIARLWPEGGIQLAVCYKNLQWSHCTAVHVVEETHTLCSCQGWATKFGFLALPPRSGWFDEDIATW